MAEATPPNGDPLAGIPSLQELAERPFVSLRQAANMTGHTYQTLLKHIKTGKNGEPPKLRAYRVGSEWRITESEMRRYLSGTTS